MPKSPVRNRPPPVVQTATTLVAKNHSGPLPAPEDFTAYDMIVPGAAERILRMAEADSAHVREMEKAALHPDAREGLIARSTALLLPITGLAVALGIIWLGGSGWAAGAIGTAALAAPLIAAILRR